MALAALVAHSLRSIPTKARWLINLLKLSSSFTPSEPTAAAATVAAAAVAAAAVTCHGRCHHCSASPGNLPHLPMLALQAAAPPPPPQTGTAGELSCCVPTSTGRVTAAAAARRLPHLGLACTCWPKGHCTLGVYVHTGSSPPLTCCCWPCWLQPP